MSHSIYIIWIDAICVTKERRRLILPSLGTAIYSNMSVQFRELCCPVRVINGMHDHVHSIFLLNPQKTISELIKQVKENSSHFIN